MKGNYLRVGICTVAREKIGIKYAKDISLRIKQNLKVSNVENVVFPQFVSTSLLSRKAAQYFLKKSVDLLLIINAAYVPAQLMVNLVQHLKVPLVIWTVAEEIKKGFPEVGSVVGLTQNAGVITKMRRDFELIFGPPESKVTLQKISSIVKTISTQKKLSWARIGQIGKGCPGMLDTEFHLLELQNRIGPEVIYISINEFIDEWNKLLESGIDENEVTKELVQKIPQYGITNKEIVTNSLKTYLALSEFVRREILDALSFRCWPELKSHGIGAPCLALSLLNDEGYPIACEGDLTAAISMLILYELTGKPAYLGDFLGIDGRENDIGLFFHCGAAASSLAEKKSSVSYRIHPEQVTWDPGITVEFPIKEGNVTFARLGEIGGKYRLLTLRGQALRTKMFCRGNPAKIKFKKDVHSILEKLIKSGAEHHQIMVHGDLHYELALLCRLLGIEFIEV